MLADNLGDNATKEVMDVSSTDYPIVLIVWKHKEVHSMKTGMY